MRQLCGYATEGQSDCPYASNQHKLFKRSTLSLFNVGKEDPSLPPSSNSAQEIYEQKQILNLQKWMSRRMY